MNRRRLAPCAAALVLSLTVVPAMLPALAQKATLAPGLAKVSREPKVIVNQIQLAIEEEKKALAGFESAASEEALIEARQAAINAYVLIRSARNGVEDIRDRNHRQGKFPDPLLELVWVRIDRAWNTSRWPVDAYQPPGSGRARYIQDSIERMRESVALLHQIIYMWP